MDKIYIIAEMAWAHDGSLDKAIKILKCAKESGADAIGIHFTDLEDYMVPYYGNGEGKVSAGREELDVYKYLVDINLSCDDWVHFSSVAREAGIDLCVMPNDMKSLEFSEQKINPEIYVVAAASFVESDFLEALARKGKKTFFRIGGAFIGEIEKALNIFRNAGNNDVVLLHGIQMYPTTLEDTNISLIHSLKLMFNVDVGLADHIDGSSPLAKILPLLAIPYGAKYIEKHITYNRDEKGEDFESALNPEDFKEFVGFVRDAEKAIGCSYMRELGAGELRYRNVVRKKIVAAGDFPKGHRIEETDVAFKRCDTGLTPDCLELVVGRILTTDVRKDDVLNTEKF